MKTLTRLCLILTLLAGLLSGCSADPAPAPVEETASIELAETEPAEMPETDETEPATEVVAAEEPPAEEPPAGEASLPEREWTVMMYQDADDQVLEEDMFIDLNEAERVGSTDQVAVVSQIDRFAGGFDGDGDWDGTYRYYLEQDDDLESLGIDPVEDLGEVNMADGQTLVDFITWAVENYPAQKYALILSDHGMGWPGGWTDPDPDEDDQIYLQEMEAALQSALDQTGIEGFELIGFDACLMSHLEVYDTIAPFARYAVASQEVEPSLGWAYSAFLTDLTADPSMAGDALAQAIVRSYIDEDERILDDDARAKLASDSFGIEGDVDSSELAGEMGRDITLTAFDLSAVSDLMSAVDSLSAALVQADPELAAEARSYAQSFESIFGDDVPPSYIDLGHFALLLQELSDDPAILEAADRVTAALGQVVLDEKHGDDRPGATGVSIYFPDSDLYMLDGLSGHEMYTTIAGSFASASSWDDFLTAYYTGGEFAPAEGEVSQPAPEAEVVSPVSEPIEISPITLSSDTASADEPVTLGASITGEGVAFIYTFIGYYDESSNSIQVADMDFLAGDDTRQIGGVYLPDWGDTTELEIEYEWPASLYALNDGAIADGASSELALFEPEDYGAPDEDSVYAVEGVYTFAESGETMYAKLFFSGGELFEVRAFTNLDGTGAPHEITPAEGDTFTLLEQWIELGEDEDSEVTFTTQEGATFQFGEDNFTWEEVAAPEGVYVVGFLVEDLDGNMVDSYEVLQVAAP